MVGDKKSTRRVNEVILLKFTGLFLVRNPLLSVGSRGRELIMQSLFHLSADWIISDNQ